MAYKTPKYYQIEQDIVRSIKAGELQPGDKVDSESILKKKYDCSTITVRKAFGDLINEGYLVGVQGVGTFVAKKQMIRGLTSISFSDELLQQGFAIDINIVSIEEIVNFSIAEKLGIENNQSIICIKRVRLANNEPMAYHTSYIDSRKLSLKNAQSITKTKSFYKTLSDNGIVPKWANENYSIKEIHDPTIASLMKLNKGSYTFFAKRIAFDEHNQIVEYSETYFNKDVYSVTVNIKI